ncbi:transforming protein RhoA-like [Haliotis rufescens]|uniref:transforming protein RhoA-like n=1 Tax=Haliotis rufescens TaxID=6454 RepID=UPI001EAFE952|nr:transforming protein RhoA-like [Haliotis rufescens]XP_048252806.1 transforming protein RhoA-like [Haliotis rufescens]
MGTEVKAIVVGDAGCGKSCLLLRFLKGHFITNDEAGSTFETGTSTVFVQGQKIELMVCDTGGSSMFDSLRQLSYNDGDVIVICYSITDRDSLQNVSERWRPEMLSHVTSDRPIVLVATKKDLRDSDLSFSSVRGSDKLHQEPVTTLEGQEMREKLDAVDFIECSAKQDDGVRELFQRVAEVGLESSRSRRKKICRQS